ncbi:MAG: agmatine deiminase family protein [Cocleimonas sp.]|nr:agmatine deiminase family protein [Cocleimonas sp.]
MFSRRYFLQKAGLLTSGLLLGCHGVANETNTKWFMPEESKPHKRTWMAFISSDAIWEDRQIPEVQKNLATLAKTIAKYEPVSLLVRPQDYTTAVQLLGGLNSHHYPINLIKVMLNDLWVRDTGPSFVINNKGEKAAINFNFNGWGEDQAFEHDAKIADFIAKQSGVASLSSSLTVEGGCFEVDGNGTAIMSESCIINDNRNPNKKKIVIENELKNLLGLKKIIWLKGIKGKDITDGHTDFYARFVKPGVVVVSRDTDKSSYDYTITRENINLLQAATDANNTPFKLIILDTPWHINSNFGTKDFAAGYVGYYVCNGAVIMQKFGDNKADKKAKAALAPAFPHHVIEQLTLDGIASGGGSIHCATQQEPK